MQLELQPEPLNRENFKIFGDVIEVREGDTHRLINEGFTQRFHDLAQLDLLAENGQVCLSIFRSMPQKLPLTLKQMERHPLSSQCFYPLSANPYLVMVAPAGKLVESNIRVFIASANQGVNYHAGTWHHYSLALNDSSDFLVVDRINQAPNQQQPSNCDECNLNQPIVISNIPGPLGSSYAG